MGKKNKKEKDELKVQDPEKVEDNDKVSIKKTFRDTGIIMGVIAAIVGILIFATKDAQFVEGQPDDNLEEEVTADPELAYGNLMKLANQELIGAKNLNRGLNYVRGLASIEYANNKVVFCALGDEQDDYSYLVKVTMNYNFLDEDGFIYKMTNLNLNNAVLTYGVSSEVYDLSFEESIGNKFDDKVSETLPKYDSNKPYVHPAYKVGDDYYFAVTYAGIDSKIYSMNDMVYNSALDSFTIISEYQISPDQNAKMYSLLSLIIAE